MTAKCAVDTEFLIKFTDKNIAERTFINRMLFFAQAKHL